MNRTPEIEYRPLDEIKKYQEQRLIEDLEYLNAKSGFYKRLFTANHIDISKIRHLEDLALVPPTEKSDLQTYNQDFLCVPKEDVIDYITTSGTLGDPVTFAMTDHDLDRLAYNEKISFEGAGAKKGDIFQLMTTIDKRFMAGLAYFLGIREIGAGIIRVGNGIPELQWDTINRIRPNAIIAVPSFILKIIKYAEDNGIDYRNSSIKKAVCIGENLRQQDFSLSLLSRRIKEKWDIDLYSTYASTEMGTSFCECEYGCGGHHHPELIICELLDEQGNVVKPGEVGELTITTLGVEGMPLLRFKTGDLASFHYEPCKCGRTTMRISPILGRKNHMIKYKGTTMYPPAVFDVLDNIPYIANYVLEVSDNDCGNDDVVVKVGLNGNADEEQAIIKSLKDRFRTRIRVAPEIEIVAPEELQKIIYRESQRKPVKFIDKRKKKDNDR
ncbi:MAG: AMP-binding protein [Bacteroidales bacterium]|nr:AMP-binding protein [Bacteroidales bacterium]MDD4670986.1 AMP-binding protein [Bacteroidales bacterium]